MIGIDLDGTILNYNNHTTKIRINPDLLSILRNVSNDRQIAIITNQGGMAFCSVSSKKYPDPHLVAMRIRYAVEYLRNHGYIVAQVHVSAYHPDASQLEIAKAARQLRQSLRFMLRDVRWTVHESARSRKPSPFMLKCSKASLYLGDSPEDMEAAKRAGIFGVLVKRYE
jgi:histidinol phosphatase-like enzyme